MTYSNMDDYKTSVACIDNYVTTSCKEVNKALDYCNNNGFYSLRIQQDEAAKDIMSTFLSNASSGANTLYTIISLCMGIVVLSSAVLAIILIVVIKDKSYVMAIFAEVTEEETKRIIKHIKTLGLSTVRFQSKILDANRENEEQYWRSVVKEHKREVRNGSCSCDTPANARADSSSNNKLVSERTPAAKGKSTFMNTNQRQDRSEDPGISLVNANTTQKDMVTGLHREEAESSPVHADEEQRLSKNRLKDTRIALLSEIE